MPVASWLQAIKDWVPKKVNLSNCTGERDPERDLVHLSERLDSLNHRLDRAAKVLYPTDFRQQQAEADRMPLTVNSLPVTPRERKHRHHYRGEGSLDAARRFGHGVVGLWRGAPAPHTPTFLVGS